MCRGVERVRPVAGAARQIMNPIERADALSIFFIAVYTLVDVLNPFCIPRSSVLRAMLLGGQVAAVSHR